MISVVQTALFKRLPADKVGMTPLRISRWFTKTRHCTQTKSGARTMAEPVNPWRPGLESPYPERAPLGGGGFAHGPEW